MLAHLKILLLNNYIFKFLKECKTAPNLKVTFWVGPVKKSTLYMNGFLKPYKPVLPEIYLILTEMKTLNKTRAAKKAKLLTIIILDRIQARLRQTAHKST